ncbi:uncharacterized protein [Pleurodeles waltl]|uniref:uncharacterized protein isoform X2 n=1 Tax=Pleurodeles waltl TaxID=8319 RepID=UPI003709784D
MGSLGGAPARVLLLAALCLWPPERGESKVYYSCGAVMSTIERGLILSPGFPNHYDAGAHCVWQFFIPAGTHLILEVFDFDVFDSKGEGDVLDPYIYPFKRVNQDSFTEEEENPKALPTPEPLLRGVVDSPEPSSRSRVQSGGSWLLRTQKKTEPEVVERQRLLTSLDVAATGQSLLHSKLQAMFEAKHPSWIEEYDREYGSKDVGGGSKFSEDPSRQQNQAEEDDGKFFQVHSDVSDSGTPSSTPWVTDTSDTMPPPAEACPHDVLYISDLVTFSSRFCGANSPQNRSLVFGSPSVMMEVIMELITTTTGGRGFLVLFDYQNISGVTAMNIQEQRDREHLVVLAILAGVATLVILLLSVTCLVYRRRLCPKRTPSSTVLGEQESGIQNGAVDINELQLVVPGQENQNNNHSVGRNTEEYVGEQSDLRPVMAPTPSMAESGSDEVFVISAGHGARDFDFTSYPVQKNNSLRRTMTSPSSVSNWQTWDPSTGSGDPVDRGDVSSGPDPPRRRTWSVRTFHDFLAPLPKLQKKWCSWSTGSPFTKLVDSGLVVATGNSSEDGNEQTNSTSHMGRASEPPHSQSSHSNASHPLSQSAQRQRKVYTGSLKKSHFGSPYFGFRASSPDEEQVDCSRATRESSPVEIPHIGQETAKEGLSPGKRNLGSVNRTKDFCMEIERSKPVFVISEEEDQQPLVLAEQLSTGGDAECAEGRMGVDHYEPRHQD